MTAALLSLADIATDPSHSITVNDLGLLIGGFAAVQALIKLGDRLWRRKGDKENRSEDHEKPEHLLQPELIQITNVLREISVTQSLMKQEMSLRI